MTRVLTRVELECLTALVDCLMPADDLGASATEAGVVDFIDDQLGGAYGAGKGTHLGTEDEGLSDIEQIAALAPLPFYRTGIATLNDIATRTAGALFAALKESDRHQLLTAIEQNAVGHPWIGLFLDQVIVNTMEGYFSDPRHGGNRDAAGWKMIGFPGCGHDYRDFVGRNVPVSRLVPIQTIADFEGR